MVPKRIKRKHQNIKENFTLIYKDDYRDFYGEDLSQWISFELMVFVIEAAKQLVVTYEVVLTWMLSDCSRFWSDNKNQKPFNGFKKHWRQKAVVLLITNKENHYTGRKQKVTLNFFYFIHWGDNDNKLLLLFKISGLFNSWDYTAWLHHRLSL